MHKKVFQCDPLVTPESILHAAEQVERLQLKQQKLSFKEHVGVLVLEEVGVTVLSPHNPLRSLHSFLTVELRWMVISSISASLASQKARGSSEFQLSDLFSAYPTPADFHVTGKQIIVGSSRGDRKRTRTGTVERLSSVLSSLTSILSNTIISDPRYNCYYGLRDYYGLVKFSQAEQSSSAANGLAPGTL